MKIIYKILIVLGVLLFLVGGMLFDAFYAAPRRITTRYETLSSLFIYPEMNDVNILFFTDVHYGSFFDQGRLNNLVDKIKSTDSDVVIFGGDLFDSNPTSEDIKIVTQALKSIDAPLGKFAVLGDFDYMSTNIQTIVEQVLTEADFEIITNRYVTIRNQGSRYINLVGVDSEDKGNPNVTQAFANLSPNSYIIAVSHCPDIAASYPQDLVNYALAGHSHGTQAFLLFTSLYNPPFTEIYNRGKNTVGNFTLDISSGVGTTEKDIRFLANSEIVIYRLKSLQIIDENINETNE